MESIDTLITELRNADPERRETIKAELEAHCRAGGDARSYIETRSRGEILEVQWELEEVLEATAPKKVEAPTPPEPEPEPEPEPADKQLTAADLDIVYDDPRGLVLHRTKDGLRWFATQVDPRSGQPQTFELHASEVEQLKKQLAGSPYWMLGRWRGVLSALALLLALGCGGWRKEVRRGDAWMEAQNPGAAARAYDKAVDKREEDPELRLKLAEALLEDEQFDRALTHARYAWSEAPDPRTRRAYARALLGCWELQALGDLEATPEIRDLQAEALLAQGELDQAAAHLSAPGSLAWVAARQGRTLDLEALHHQALETADPVLWADLGAAWLVLGDTERAATARAQTLSADSRARERVAEWVSQGARAADAGLWEAALRQTLRGALLAPEDADIAWATGAFWLSAGEDAQGAAWLARTLEMPPYNALQEDRGAIAVANTTGSPPEERARLRAEIALPLAEAHMRLGDFESEIQARRIVAEGESPPDPGALLHLAAAYSRAGRHLDAAELAQQAAKTGYPGASAQVARAFAAAGSVQQATGWADKAIREDPSDIDSVLLLARLLERQGQTNSAVAAVEAGLAENPDSERLRQERDRLLRP